MEASFEDARREVEQQTRRRCVAEQQLSVVRGELRGLKASHLELREAYAFEEARARQACEELEACREARERGSESVRHAQELEELRSWPQIAFEAL